MKLIDGARKLLRKNTAHSMSPKNRLMLAAAIIATLLLCGLAVYQAGLFYSWFQTPSLSPVETVQNAIENEITKDDTIMVQVGEVNIDKDATAWAQKRYQGSDLTKENGWSDEYIENNMIVVYAEYYVEYDHAKTFQPDGNIEKFFILIRDEKTQEWKIWDSTTNGDPFYPRGDSGSEGTANCHPSDPSAGFLHHDKSSRS